MVLPCCSAAASPLPSPEEMSGDFAQAVDDFIWTTSLLQSVPNNLSLNSHPRFGMALQNNRYEERNPTCDLCSRTTTGLQEHYTESTLQSSDKVASVDCVQGFIISHGVEIIDLCTGCEINSIVWSRIKFSSWQRGKCIWWCHASNCSTLCPQYPQQTTLEWFHWHCNYHTTFNGVTRYLQWNEWDRVPCPIPSLPLMTIPVSNV